MMMKLVFPAGESPQRLLDVGTYRIGSADDAELQLAGEGVEPLHGELRVAAQGVQLRVPQGLQVQVNGRPVDGVIALRGDDMLAFGAVHARLVEAAFEPPQRGGQAPLGERVDPQATMIRPVVPKFALRGLSGPMFGRSFPLQTAMSVGRADDADLRIPSDGISRQHARLTPAGDEVLVEDLGSANGTWLNGRRITRASAAHGDEIRFDKERFQLLAPGQPVATRHVDRNGPSARWPWVLAALLAGVALAAWLIL